MSLEIIKLQKDGDANNEFIMLEAIADVDLVHYAIIDRTFDKDGNLSNVHRHFFRFPSKKIKSGEYVVLCTGKGKQREVELDGGKLCHLFYWGSDSPFWNDDEVEQAELLYIVTLDRKKK